jgi:hypothetical protein
MTNLLQTFFLLGSLGIAASRTCLALGGRLIIATSPLRLTCTW